jgi:uncharacterized protein
MAGSATGKRGLARIAGAPGSRISPEVDRGGRCAIAVMAKAPRAGAAKTRLSPPLSAAEAAELSACFIADSASNIVAAARAAPIDAYVAYSPPGSAAAFRELLPAEIGLLPPRRIGLGESLSDAAADLLDAGYGALCLVNSDSPTLPTAILVRAAKSLLMPGDRVVLGPAADGGYYLIGLKAPHAELFAGIDWATERVFRQTLQRARSLGLAPIELPGWYDVDDGASLERLHAELDCDPVPLPGGGARHAAPCTSAFLRRLDAGDWVEGAGPGLLRAGRRGA